MALGITTQTGTCPTCDEALHYNADEAALAATLRGMTVGGLISRGWEMLRSREWGNLRILCNEAEMRELEARNDRPKAGDDV